MLRHALAGAAVVLLVLAAPGHAARALSVASVGASPATAVAGGQIAAGGHIANRGDRARSARIALWVRAGATRTRIATARVPRVRAHSRTRFRVAGTLPAKLRPGRYRVIVCVSGACRTAPGRLTVTAPAESEASTSPVEEPAGSAPAPEPVTPPATAAPGPPTPDTPPVDYTPGARTGGDSLFPTIGNGGYDVQHYALDLSYTITTKILQGTATIRAVATQDLSELSLDLQYLGATAVRVNGVPATFTQDWNGAKLIVTPAQGIRDGAEFTLAIDYAGVEQPVIDPDGSSEGWVPSTTYGAIVVAEPIGAQGWFPNNNVPYDRATFEVRMRVPEGWDVVATGDLLSTDTADGFTTYHWSESKPIPTYLASVAIGHYDLSYSQLTGGPRPLYVAMDASFTNKATIGANQQRVPQILQFYADWYGVDYPWTTAGGIVPRQSVGYSLETATKPIYATTTAATTTGPSITTIAHEQAHQWFGDLVTLARWRDIWLNEGMTEFSSWVWQERENGGTATATRFANQYNSTSTTFWRVPPADPPTAADIFDSNAMYTRGAMVMEAIRQIVGEPTFLDIQRAWLQEHAYSAATTEDYIATVKRLSGKDPDCWDEFFQQWLYTSYTGSPAAGNKPQITPANFDASCPV